MDDRQELHGRINLLVRHDSGFAVIDQKSFPGRDDEELRLLAARMVEAKRGVGVLIGQHHIADDALGPFPRRPRTASTVGAVL